ncbi:hypothetical protein PVAND_006920 [Polypedilum vanderplanki]|uniref:Cuticular protein n=1 Tax=Polypedilum vanderplanki TaxID=319348 RepID=A0A9J6C543_POLVA|nr:hypothetical protein PVAND_006920 [Polypedilum vanderplanki]
MKVIVALSAVLAVASAIPITDYHQDHYSTTPIPILKFDSQQNHDGSYQYGYETGNGIQVQEQGYIKNAGVKDAEIQVQQGYYSYVGPDGHPVSFSYIADENGFQVKSDAIPTPPPLPKEIADVWARINAQPQQYQHDDNHLQQSQQQQYYSKTY